MFTMFCIIKKNIFIILRYDYIYTIHKELNMLISQTINYQLYVIINKTNILLLISSIFEKRQT